MKRFALVLDLTYLKEHGRRRVSRSIWTRVLIWLRYLGVAVTGAARATVPVDDLRPRARNIQITLDAVDDIRLCESLFDKWITELDKVPNNLNNSDQREQKLRLHHWRLNERAQLCSDKTNEILQYHVRFASLMAQQIDDASKSQYYLKYTYSGPLGEMTRLAAEVRRTIDTLSVIVEQVTDELKLFVLALEKVQATVKKEPSVAKQIPTIFATSSPSNLGTARHHPDPKIRGSRLADTALRQAASDFFKVDSEHQEGKESESLDSVILFLKEIVPREAKNVPKKLEQSDEPTKIMERMRAGQRVTLYGSDAAGVAEEWRDVAKQYQTAFEQKKRSLS